MKTKPFKLYKKTGGLVVDIFKWQNFAMNQDKRLKKFLSERKSKKATAGVREIASKNKALRRLLAKTTNRFNPLQKVGPIPTAIPMSAKTGKYVSVKCKLGRNKKTKVT